MRDKPSFLIQVADAYIASEDAYYFQRSPTAFEAVFQYYATGVVHRPSEVGACAVKRVESAKSYDRFAQPHS